MSKSKSNKKRKNLPFGFVQKKPGSFFETHKGSKTRVSTHILKFAKFYGHLTIKHKIAICFLLGLIMCFITLFFAESTGLTTSGLSGLLQNTARLTRVALCVYKPELGEHTINLIYTLMYWGQYLLLNLGLFFLAYRKIGKEFATLSLIYLATVQIGGFAFQQIPALQNINLFGESSTINAVLDANNVKSLVFYNNWFPTLVDHNYDWTHLIARADAPNAVVSSIDSSSLTHIFCLLIYALIYASFAGCVDALLLISGGSAAGGAILSTYLSEKKNKPVGTMLTTINVTGLVLGVILGTYVSGILVDPKYYKGVEYFFSGNLVCSTISAVVNGLILNALFPWRKLVKLEVYSDNFNDIKNYLYKIGYTRGITCLQAMGAHNKKKFTIGIFICQMVEINRLTRYCRQLDPDCFITATYVDDIDGDIIILRQASNRKWFKKKK